MDLKRYNLPQTCSFCAGTMLIEILRHYAKTSQFRGTLWEMELKSVQPHLTPCIKAIYSEFISNHP